MGTSTLLLGWNAYRRVFLPPPSQDNMSVPAAPVRFFDSHEAPSNLMMATVVIRDCPRS